MNLHSRSLPLKHSLWLILLNCIFALVAHPLHSQITHNNVDLGGQVVAFCQASLGKQVGNGECSSLADAALESSSAQGCSGSAPGGDDYTWGDFIALIDSKGRTNYDREVQARKAKPGDIVQFRDVLFASSYNGSYSTRHHHTAVIIAVTGYGKQIHILEQNFGGSRVVIKNILNVDDMREGWMRVYRPAARK